MVFYRYGTVRYEFGALHLQLETSLSLRIEFRQKRATSFEYVGNLGHYDTDCTRRRILSQSLDSAQGLEASEWYVDTLILANVSSSLFWQELGVEIDRLWSDDRRHSNASLHNYTFTRDERISRSRAPRGESQLQ